MLLYTNAQMPYTCTIFDKILKTDGNSRLMTTQNGPRPILNCHLIDIDNRLSDVFIPKPLSLRTQYINVYSGWFRCPYSVTGCTTVWPWSSPLCVGDYVVWFIIKDNIGSVYLNPSPFNVGVWVCISHHTHQCSCLPFQHYIRTWCYRLHFWFICSN